jgi:hypothetical protein
MSLQWVKMIPCHGWLKLAATGTAIGVVSAVSILFVEKWSKTRVYSLVFYDKRTTIYPGRTVTEDVQETMDLTMLSLVDASMSSSREKTLKEMEDIAQVHANNRFSASKYNNYWICEWDNKFKYMLLGPDRITCLNVVKNND